MKPIMDEISELIETELVNRLEKLPKDKTWGWLHLGEDGRPPTLTVQIALNEDDTVDVDVNLERVIEENIESWVSDEQYEELEQWRDMFVAFSAKMTATLLKRS